MGNAALIDARRSDEANRVTGDRLTFVVQAAIGVEGAALAVLVGRDGTPSWQVLRVVAVAVATIATGWFVGRSGRVGLAFCALVTGVIGTVAGAGIGAMHLVKGAVTPAGIAGIGCLAAGIVLLVVGIVVGVRLLTGWWRLLALPAALIVVQFLLIPLPVSIYATNVPPTVLGDRTPADAGLPYDDVEFNTADGVTLSGWYIPSSNGAALALLHGSGSTRSAVLDHASLLARHGYGVLLYDDRGHGRSGGDGMDFGWWGDLDLDAAITFLEGRPDVMPDRVGAVGLSMGGEQAINAAATDERIRAVVAEGVEPRLPADHDIHTSGPTGWVENAVNVITVETADLLTDAPMPMPLRDAVRAIAPRPILIIAGRGEIDAMQAVAATAPADVDLWALPRTPHTGGLDERPAEWSERVTSFLDRSLLDQSPVNESGESG